MNDVWFRYEFYKFSSHTKGIVTSLFITTHDLPEPTAPSPYPLILSNPPIANAWYGAMSPTMEPPVKLLKNET